MKPKRYLIMPSDGIRLGDAAAGVSDAARATLRAFTERRSLASLSRRTESFVSGVVRAGRRNTGGTAAAPAFKVVASLGEDSVKLVEGSPAMMAALRQQNPGVRVVEENFCRPALAPRVKVPPRPAAPAGAAHVTAGTLLTVEVVRAGTGAPVSGADVIVFRTRTDALQKKTNAAGQAKFSFNGPTASLSRLFVYHEEPGLWGFFKANVTAAGGNAKVKLAALDLSAVDSLRHFHATGQLADGAGVKVGVIDSGADTSHPDLVIAGGANCVPASTRPAGDFGPSGPHGTHVAGTIAARGSAPTGVRGMAPGATLMIYRVFEDGNENSGSSFAVIDAIERAIAEQCDIVNLSLTFEVTDEGVAVALAKARNHGILAVAAAGNDARQPVGFPGSDSNCVAVSAAGRNGLFPVTATETSDVAAPFGLDPKNFIGAFSNAGADLDYTGAGVGVVSSVPGGYAPMSGTSMASPAIAGVAARLLAGNPTILAMPRNAARTDAMRAMLTAAAISLGFTNLFQGAGLSR